MAIVLIHGGCSNQPISSINDAKKSATDNTAQNLTIASGASAIDLVEAAVIAQELNPELNAGRGSVIQMDGRIRMDAAICDSKGRYGAVIQLEQVANPIKVARQVLNRGYHSILSGEGALRFALECGFATLTPYTAETVETFLKSREQFPNLTYDVLAENADDIKVLKLGTVGAVALDERGNLAAACSTGGTKYCYPGRVGDTPIFGAGLYCSEHIAVACTGEGDKVLRRLTCRRVEDYYLQHGSLQKAADEAAADLLNIQNGYAGLIAISHKGETAVSHTTSFMAHARAG